LKEIPNSYEEQQNNPVEPSVSSEQEIANKKKKFEDLWKDENEIDEAASVLNYLDSVQSTRRATENVPTSSFKIVDVATPVQTPERLPRGESEKVEEPDRQLSESLVDRVPETTEIEATEDDRMNLPLPATLETNFQDASSNQKATVAAAVTPESEDSSVLSNASGSSSRNKHLMVGESAHRKKANKWVPSSPSGASSEGSVCSTDSSKLRSLLGQSDTNDAAIAFGKQPKDDNSTSSSSATPEAEVSMSSCTSGHLKSLLITDNRDTASDDGSEDFLFKNEIPVARRIPEEEKKKTPILTKTI